MPTYAYRCTQCGDEFDIKQSFTDDALTLCAACGGALRKLFGSVGVVFKGSGFYRTDSAAEAKASRRSANSGSKSDSGSDGKSGSDSSSSSSSGGSKESASSSSGSTSSAGSKAAATAADS